MDDIGHFLTRHFLPRRNSEGERRSRRNQLSQPDGRSLFRYECSDEEFWHLVELLKHVGCPHGYDFNRYRDLWYQRKEGRAARRHSHPTHDFDDPLSEMSNLSWTIRGFVLYASECWRRFLNEYWRQGKLDPDLDFQKLTWAHFLSLIDWLDLYRGKITAYARVGDTEHFVAHDDTRLHDADATKTPRDGRKERRPIGKVVGTGHYPVLYFPMQAAWDWWGVPLIRLPTSIRYLDTIAHQGGAVESLVMEYEHVFDQRSKRVYRATKPPHGHGTELVSLDEAALPPGADWRHINVTVVGVGK